MLSYKGTGRDGTVMFGSVPANVPLAEDVYFTKISDSFELQPPSRTTINCNLLMETVTIEGEVISTANRSPVRYYVLTPTGSFLWSVTPKSAVMDAAVAHQLTA